MSGNEHLRRTLTVSSSVSSAVVLVTVHEFAAALELSKEQFHKLTTTASELASNIVKYANWGRITLQAGQARRKRWVDVTAVDRGPGIADVEAAMRDHYSTGGSLGLGLPGVRRLMDEFFIETVDGQGCTVRARMWLHG